MEEEKEEGEGKKLQEHGEENEIKRGDIVEFAHNRATEKPGDTEESVEDSEGCGAILWQSEEGNRGAHNGFLRPHPYTPENDSEED